jgi:signal transduction histidine kinase
LIRRLVTNLLDNAVRHSSEGTTVRIALREEHGGYRLEVADQGRGIPPEHQPHVFERFYRIEASRTRARSDGGAGLGLAVARWVARVHGGDITLKSSSADGSTFSAFLPSRG